MSRYARMYLWIDLHRFLLMIMPLITAPYISRAMGAENLGIFSYNYSIVQYFMLFSLLGLSNYGNRVISKCKDDKKKLSEEFYSLYSIQLVSSLITLIIYIIYIIFVSNNNFNILIIMIIYLFSSCFDINWLLFGLEKFKLTITKNVIIKIISVISIFVFVKDKNDLLIYALIMSITTLITQICLWPYVIKEIKFSKPNWKTIKKHIKPNLILFVPVIAISLYKLMDKIMLGMLSTMPEVGFYESAEKIINMPIAFITALGTVMLPRVTNLISKNEETKISKYIDESMNFIMFITIPICLGLITISKNFSIIFYGKEFEKTGTIIALLSLTLPFSAWANVIRTQILIPREKDSIYIKSVFLGALINLIINYILILKLNSIGAAIGTIIAEAVVMIYQTYKIKNKIPIKKYLKEAIIFLIKGLLMYIILYSLNLIIKNKELLMTIQIIMGILIYGLLNRKYIIKSIKNIKVS